ITCMDGVRLYGTQMSIVGARFEENKTAIHNGVEGNGAVHLIDRAFFGSISGEANWIFIQTDAGANIQFTGCVGQGSTGSNVYNGQSAYGIIDKTNGQALYTSCQTTGTYNKAGIQVRSYESTWINCQAQNSYPAKPAWDFAFYQDNQTTPFIDHFINCTSYTYDS